MPETRGECAVCGRHFQITRSGKIRHHMMPRRPSSWYRSPVCDGAGRDPEPASGPQPPADGLDVPGAARAEPDGPEKALSGP